MANWSDPDGYKQPDGCGEQALLALLTLMLITFWIRHGGN